MVSEMLHRPVNRVTQLREARRTAVREPAEPEAPVTVRGRRRWGRIHPRVVIATGLVAFVVAAAALTLPELLFGGAVANDHRTTIFGGGKATKTKAEQSTEQVETTTTTETQTTPAQEPAPTSTETTPTETTPAETAPSGGTPAPGEPTTTETAPAQTPPSG
jgi:hypothetical protein